MMNTKAKFMIVTPTNPKKSSLMITNNTDSTIAPPPVVNLTSQSCGIICTHQRVKGGNALRFILISYVK